MSSGFKCQGVDVSRNYCRIISKHYWFFTAFSRPRVLCFPIPIWDSFSSSFPQENREKKSHHESARHHYLIALDNTVSVFTALGCNNKSSLDGVCTHLLKILKLVLVRYQIRARVQFPIATSPPYLYPPAGYFSKPKGHSGPGAVSCSPRRGLRASPPEPPKEGPSAEQQVSRGRGDLCRLQGGREDPRPPAGAPGPTGTTLDPAAARVTRPPPDELGVRQLRGQRQGGGSRARKSKGARPRPTSNKSKSPQGTRSAALARCNRTLRPPYGVLASAGYRWCAGNRTPAGLEGRSPAAPAPTAGRSAPAPHPLPPAGTPPARARFAVFAPLESEGGAGSARGRPGEAGRGAGLRRRGTQGGAGLGVSICLSEREDFSGAPATAPRMRAAGRPGAAASSARRGGERGTVTSRKRRGRVREALSSKLVQELPRSGCQPPNASLRLGKERGGFSLFVVLF